MATADSRRMLALWSFVAFALSFVLLAPVKCMGYCEDFGPGVGVDGRCLSSCTTLLGYSAPRGLGWLLVPIPLIGVLLFRRQRHRMVASC